MRSKSVKRTASNLGRTLSPDLWQWYCTCFPVMSSRSSVPIHGEYTYCLHSIRFTGFLGLPNLSSFHVTFGHRRCFQWRVTHSIAQTVSLRRGVRIGWYFKKLTQVEAAELELRTTLSFYSEYVSCHESAVLTTLFHAIEMSSCTQQ
jgi:hypothetical protein